VTTLVRDLMHPGVVRCDPENSLGKVAKLLAEHHVHSLFIFNEDELPIGVITDYDVMAGEWLSGDPEGLEVMRGMTARELMSSPVEMIDIDTPSDEAAQRMRAGDFRRLLVTENNKPVGVISVSDFLSNIVSKTTLRRHYVGDVMSDAYLVCRDKTPVISAVRAMTDSGWRSVVIADPHGKPLGIFSGLDLLSLSDYEQIPNELLVTELMHPPLTISIRATLNEAAEMMIDEHHHRILVIDPDHVDSLPLGVISSFDIVSEMARPDSVWQR
jgi:CBS domain-containing protein